MKTAIFPSGPFLVNTALIWDEESKEAALIDPADRRGVEELKELADRKGLKVKYIVNTHEHPDHTGGNSWAKLLFKEAKLVMHPEAAKYLDFWTESEIGQMAGAEYSPQPEITVEEGDTIKLGNFSFRVLHTPGHSPGSIVLYSREGGLAVVGDLIFKGSIGRYDLPMSSHQELIRSLLKVLDEVDKSALILPGHGETTNLKEELENNPFLRGLF
jgi:glyoxylase-like metal-dependent hydrolase (beta-lactamase superfamily II)